MQKHIISAQKTARYFTLGKLCESTISIWFVLHGYGQLASDFLPQFQELADDGAFVVAPEGLSHFYFKGFGGNPGASWMTREDREADILDYVYFLDKVYNDINWNVSGKADFHLLGFSQGAETAARWFTLGRVDFSSLILFGGSIPRDIDAGKFKRNTENSKIYLCHGMNDRFINEQKADEELLFVSELNVKTEHVKFPGGHEIHLPTLRRIAQEV